MKADYVYGNKSTPFTPLITVPGLVVNDSSVQVILKCS